MSSTRKPTRRLSELEREIRCAFKRRVCCGRCRACGAGRAQEAHHVVYRQELRRRGLPQWDSDDGLALCHRCHERHHNGGRWKISLTVLSSVNLDYAFAVLGAFAYDYLSARYAGEDPRLEERLAAAEDSDAPSRNGSGA